MSDFADRYGPWALILGASDGVGAAYAEAMADRGINVVLLARRQAKLDEVAARISGVRTRTIAVDLTAPDAMLRIIEATDGLDIGMILYCAGADPNYQPFLAGPVEDALDMVRRNCVLPTLICHHFAAPMVNRGRGGIILVSSGAALAGAPNMVAYGASKAFDLVMAEALWTELNGQGVDVLALVLGATDTPALRTLLTSRGMHTGIDDPIPGACQVDEVVAEAIANLANGPTHFVGDQMRGAAEQLGKLSRNDAVRAMLRLSDETMGAS